MAKGCSFFIGDNMTKEEKAIRNEQMRQYKAEGHTMAEVAEKFNLHEVQLRRYARVSLRNIGHAKYIGISILEAIMIV